MVNTYNFNVIFNRYPYIIEYPIFKGNNNFLIFHDCPWSFNSSNTALEQDRILKKGGIICWFEFILTNFHRANIKQFLSPFG